MWTREYVITVLVITIATLTIGFFVWNSGTQQLSPGTYNFTCEGWCHGAESPLVIIDAYPDFECPICVNKQKLIMQALDIYPDEVRLDYHHYPYNDFSYKLAEALEAAGEQGKFWELHDKIFLQAVPGDMSDLLAAAEDVGLDMVLFNDSLNSGKFTDKVLADREQAISDGARPMSVYINGNEYRKYPGTPADLCSAIDEELERIEANGGN